MEYFDDIHKYGNIFSFYLSLVNATLEKFGLEYLSAYTNFYEGEIDAEISDLFGASFPNSKDYFRYISKTQSGYLFHSLESRIEKIKNMEKRDAYWKDKSNKIDYYIHKIKSNKEIDVHEQEGFLTDLGQIKKDIEVRFPELFKSEDNATKLNNSKVVWLGSTKQLATLIYDLWQGQKKVKGKTTKPLIKASKGELMNLLLNNFVGLDNKPLNKSTLSDYLNTSEAKQAQKAAPGEGGRIELDYD